MNETVLMTEIMNDDGAQEQDAKRNCVCAVCCDAQSVHTWVLQVKVEKNAWMCIFLTMRTAQSKTRHTLLSCIGTMVCVAHLKFKDAASVE